MTKVTAENYQKSNRSVDSEEFFVEGLAELLIKQIEELNNNEQ